MHSERPGKHRNSREFTGAHVDAQERLMMSEKGHRTPPPPKRTITNLTSDVVVADVLFVCVLLLRRFFELKKDPQISNPELTRKLVRYLNIHTRKQ